MRWVDHLDSYSRRLGRDRGVFLTADDVDAAREAIADILRRPTAAGATLDAAELRRLLGQLDDMGKPCAQDTPPTVVSTKGQRLLRIIAAQAAIRHELPMKIVRRCADCGSLNISDPEYEVNKRRRDDVRFIVAMINALMGSVPDSVDQEDRICDKCKGSRLDPPILATFCRKCHELRDENVLVKCPKCNFNFLSLEHENLWEGIEDATRKFKLNVNLTLLQEAIPEFEDGLYRGQVRALVEAISAEEILLGMCRCAWGTELGRHVALLLTSKKLVWSWETPISATDSGMVAWQDARRVQNYNDMGVPAFCGFQLDLKNGKPIIFTGFLGTGIKLSGRTVNFSLHGVRELVRALVAEGDVEYGIGT